MGDVVRARPAWRALIDFAHFVAGTEELQKQQLQIVRVNGEWLGNEPSLVRGATEDIGGRQARRAHFPNAGVSK